MIKYPHIKAIVDRIAGLLLLLVLSPFFLLIMLVLKVSTGKVFFSQVRTGYRQKTFVLHKFTTMRDAPDHDLSESNRITPTGKYLRMFSLDELPQLWNVVQGEMSLVGPRPLPNEYLPLMTSKYKRRYQVLPGITGLSQVHESGSVDWRRRFEYDLEYVQNISFLLDLKILIMTFSVIIRPYKNQPGSFQKFEGFN